MSDVGASFEPSTTIFRRIWSLLCGWLDDKEFNVCPLTIKPEGECDIELEVKDRWVGIGWNFGRVCEGR